MRTFLSLFAKVILNLFVQVVRLPDNWGISSNGRAPALHAGSTGIDARILYDFFFLFSVS